MDFIQEEALDYVIALSIGSNVIIGFITFLLGSSLQNIISVFIGGVT